MSKILAFALSALTAIAAAEIAIPARAPDVPPAAAAPRRPTAPKAAKQPRNEKVAAILARPLFAPTRRPVAAPPHDAAGAGQAALPRLTGVMITPAGRTALFAPAEKGRLLVLHEGDQIGPLKIRAITPGYVEAAGPGGLVRMRVSWRPTQTVPVQALAQDARRVPLDAHSREVDDGRQE